MPGTPPNILWIVTTQWRAQATGYAGDLNARTPHLDALAAQALNYTQAVTSHPFGPFARAALLTGAPSPENGIRDYFDPLPTNARTIAHALSERGYVTGFFGKWHLGQRDCGAPLVGEAHAKIIVPAAARGGFDEWEGFESGFLLNDPFLHGTRLAEPTRFTGYQSDVVSNRAGEWLAARSGRSWFCIVSLEPPHPPYDAASAGIASRPPNEIDLPPNVPRGGDAETRARRELAGYYAHIEATDRAIGRLLAAPALNDAIVVFTSVHGDMHGAHGLFRKGWPHEESVRVPLLVRLPSSRWRATEKARSDAPVSLLDLSRWTCTWADGGPVIPPIVAGDAAFQRISMPSVVTLPDQCDRVWRGVRSAARKLVLNDDGSPWLYFDLQQDPLEMKNLVTDPSRAREIRHWQSLV